MLTELIAMACILTNPTQCVLSEPMKFDTERDCFTALTVMVVKAAQDKEMYIAKIQCREPTGKREWKN